MNFEGVVMEQLWRLKYSGSLGPGKKSTENFRDEKKENNLD
jgi:hypothetical protein